jgi:streptogramin lyase
MTRKVTVLVLPLLALACNHANLGGETDCVEGDTACQALDPNKPPPGGPGAYDKVGPSGTTPFDPSDDGSSGVKVDKDGNVVLDTKSFGGTLSPIIWVANSADGTVSKIDTRTLAEVGRYYTHPGGKADPSRTTVGLNGDVVVANRSSYDGNRASAVHIAGDKSQCIDRNANGKIDTSENGTPMAWADGQPNNPTDECILWFTKLTPNSLPRAAGFNAGLGETDTVVYIGMYGTRELVRLNAKTGAIMKTISVAPAMPYGLVLDKNGDVWVRGAEGSLAVVQVSKGDQVKVYNGALAPQCAYGIAADAAGRIYTAGGSCVGRFDPATEKWENLDLQGQGMQSGRGLAVDNKTGVWIADTYTGMYHVDGSGAKMVFKGKTANVSSNNVGAAIDFDNNPWVISQANSAAYKINSADYSTQKVNVGSGPYTYSDMTGYQLRNAGAPSGFWRHTFPGCMGAASTRWLELDYKVQAPAGTQVAIRVRSANDKTSLLNTPWIDVAKVPADVTPVKLPALSGALMQVEFGMKSAVRDVTPILSGVSAGFSCVFG